MAFQIADAPLNGTASLGQAVGQGARALQAQRAFGAGMEQAAAIFSELDPELGAMIRSNPKAAAAMFQQFGGAGALYESLLNQRQTGINDRLAGVQERTVGLNEREFQHEVENPEVNAAEWVLEERQQPDGTIELWRVHKPTGKATRVDPGDGPFNTPPDRLDTREISPSDVLDFDTQIAAAHRLRENQDALIAIMKRGDAATLIGGPGALRRSVGEVDAALTGFAQILGVMASEALQDLPEGASSAYVELLRRAASGDPDLAAVEALRNVVAYGKARELRPDGRLTIGEIDRQFALLRTGDPTQLLNMLEAMRTGTDRRLQFLQEQRRRALTGDVFNPSTPFQPPGSPPAPTTGAGGVPPAGGESDPEAARGTVPIDDATPEDAVFDTLTGIFGFEVATEKWQAEVEKKMREGHPPDVARTLAATELAQRHDIDVNEILGTQ